MLEYSHDRQIRMGFFEAGHCGLEVLSGTS